MSTVAGSVSLVDEILSSDRPQVKRLAAEGVLPLPPAELVPLQVRLARGGDAELAAAARESLLALEPEIVVPVLAEGAGPEVLRFFALESREPEVREAVLRRRDAAPDLLVEMARSLEPELQEVLILRQDAIAERPEILDALAENPELAPFVRRRIGEYREHLVGRPREEEPEEEAEGEPDEASEEELAEAIEKARTVGPVEGEIDVLTGLSESQVRTLPVSARLRLARGAPRGLRSILVRDPNARVALAVLSHNAVSEAEVEQIATLRTVAPEVLETIAHNRQWVRRYAVVAALVRNPRTPVGLAVRLAARLSIRELRAIGRDHNVADAVRSTARRMYRIKSQ